ncbi:MAG: FtsX-like permease family protein [Proteobacteria bacterium]|nr:FtsX-like permease family protein [Pseudomonadota bacterium]
MPASFSTVSRLAWRNTTRNWRRSFASSLAIATGFTAISLFDGFLGDLKFIQEDGYTSRGMLGDVLIQRPDAQHKLIEEPWKFALTADEQVFLDKIVLGDEDVALRVRFLEVKGMISNGQNNAVFFGSAHDLKEGLAARAPLWKWNVLAGKPLHLMDTENVILTGMGLGRMMDCLPEVDVINSTKRGGGYIAEERPFKCLRPRLQLSASTEASQVNALDLTVAGLMDQGFREMDQHWVQMPLTTGQKLLDTDKITLMAVRLKPGKDPGAFRDRMKMLAAKEGRNFDIMPWRDHSIGAFIRSTNQILNTFRMIFMTIVVTIVVLSVANTMIKAVNERIREIGTLRSFGFRRRDIRVIFTLEGFSLALLSCGAGIILTILLSLAVNHSGIRYRAGMLSVPVFLTIGMSPIIWMMNGLWLTLLASGTAWFSSRNAAKMIVADALRHS